ncbi:MULTISPECIES: glycosyltransferase family 4 protein [Chromobacterium]|uniref:Glycosyltransferase family 1 protein n=1 Tax=Chromobacterium rhizoryzae TaxID=1778675 RepID=A0AAD0WAQ4_9NEIS|nr:MULTISPECIES: glycosyltransferase family 4 protein [Chromobacterium]AXT48278.1 glycosyltransferase family 1 protein [Chromobacterium rhizoryzae]PTU68298.1 glycosyltransferase family 1 protein [Chromobacterium haemolyticum]
MSDWVLFTESSPNVGGQELQLMQQMRLLGERGFRPVLACRPQTRVMEEACRRGLEVLPLRFRNSLHLPSILALSAWMRRHRPRLAICHSGHDSNNLAIAARLTGRGRPFLLRSRTYQPGQASAWSYNQLMDATMLPSAYLKRCLLENPAIRADKLHVVYPGIDFDALDQAAALPLPPELEQWLSRSAGPLLVQAAMLRGEKGHRTVLAALGLLKNKWPDARYVIAGEGPEQQVIAELARQLGLQHRVLLAGVVSPVAALLARADLVLMPSSYEPLGMSQIEALGLSVPVIASDTGGIPETMRHGETGVLAPPGDAAAWAEAIDQALSQLAMMKAWAQAGRVDVRSRFAPEQNLRRILELGGLNAPGL